MKHRKVATGLLVVVSAVLAGRTAAAQVPAKVSSPETAAADQQYKELSRLAQPLIAYSQVLEKLAEVVGPAVVHIESKKQASFGEGWTEEAGSGILVRLGTPPKVMVITNRHVVHAAALQNITVQMLDDRVLEVARVWDDPATDVAMLQVDVDDVPVARLGDSDKVQVGHLVAAMGSPFNHRGSLTVGVISAKHRRKLPLRGGGEERLLNQDFLQTDAAINPGNSGGPLLNMLGEVIGINTAIASSGGGNQGVAFSIPINLVKRVANDLMLSGQVSRAFIGVHLDEEFSEQAASRLGLERSRGARVSGIYQATPAEQAGLKQGDVILKLDEIDVQDHAHLINVISLTPVGKTVEVLVWRERMPLKINLTVGDRQQFEQKLALMRHQQGDQLSRLVNDGQAGVTLSALGLAVREIDAATAQSLGYGAAPGLLVIHVEKQGPAGRQLETLDFLDQVERKPVTSVVSLQETISGIDVSEGLVLRVRRLRGTQVVTRIFLILP